MDQPNLYLDNTLRGELMHKILIVLKKIKKSS